MQTKEHHHPNTRTAPTTHPQPLTPSTVRSPLPRPGPPLLVGCRGKEKKPVLSKEEAYLRGLSKTYGATGSHQGVHTSLAAEENSNWCHPALPLPRFGVGKKCHPMPMLHSVNAQLVTSLVAARLAGNLSHFLVFTLSIHDSRRVCLVFQHTDHSG